METGQDLNIFIKLSVSLIIIGNNPVSLMSSILLFNFTQLHIGKLFNRTHATVIHGLNGYEYWTKHKDELFYEDVSEYMDIFGYKKIEIKKSYNLVEDIKNCRQFKDIETIKRRIANEVY